MSEGSYHWTNYEHNEYETLFRPDGTEVTTITEPEDRNFYRDLAPVCIELNALQAENARLREQADALAEALQDLMDEQNGPPLIRDAEYWQAAWDKSAAALAAYREAGDDQLVVTGADDL